MLFLFVWLFRYCLTIYVLDKWMHVSCVMYNENGNSVSQQVKNQSTTIYIILFKVLGSFGLWSHNEIRVE